MLFVGCFVCGVLMSVGCDGVSRLSLRALRCVLSVGGCLLVVFVGVYRVLSFVVCCWCLWVFRGCWIVACVLLCVVCCFFVVCCLSWIVV